MANEPTIDPSEVPEPDPVPTTGAPKQTEASKAAPQPTPEGARPLSEALSDERRQELAARGLLGDDGLPKHGPRY